MSEFGKGKFGYFKKGHVGGRKMEAKVFRILDEVQRQGKIFGFIYHLPNSPQDQEGKDFTIFLNKNDGFSFGVTISYARFMKSIEKHPEVPQFLFSLKSSNKKILSHLSRFFCF